MMADATRDLRTHLATLKALRGAPQDKPPRVAELKAWQSQRLAASYADVFRGAAIPAPRRRSSSTTFTDRRIQRPRPGDAAHRATMARLCRHPRWRTAALAIELEALSETLDHRVARALPPGPIDEGSYARAYREAGTREERERQVALIGRWESGSTRW
jgi:hypothetical protein